MAAGEAHRTGPDGDNGATGDERQGRTGPRASSGSRHSNAWETAAAVVLSLATLASAWSGYRSARWSSENVKAHRAATAARIEATSQSNLADRQVTIDVTLFTSWLSTEQASDEQLSSSIEGRFRPDSVPAFEAWYADAQAGSLSPGSPFDRPEYVLPATLEAERLLDVSAAEADHADTASQNGDNFVLVAALYASVLFLAGIATKISSPRSSHATVALGAVMFLAATAAMLTMPMNVRL